MGINIKQKKGGYVRVDILVPSTLHYGTSQMLEACPLNTKMNVLSSARSTHTNLGHRRLNKLGE